MINFSLIDGVFIDPLKQAIVTPLIKKPSLSKDDLKTTHRTTDQCPVLVSSQRLLNVWSLVFLVKFFWLCFLSYMTNQKPSVNVLDSVFSSKE